jgi:prolyl-tRNA editing enzyme YbaK/EbsC (Cys-tRNA(Pro) deacylase)
MSTQRHSGTMAKTRVEAIVGFLDGTGIPYELVEHEPVMSAAEEARVAQLPPVQVAKTVVLQDGRAYVIAAVSAACRLDLGKLRNVLGATRQLRLASEAEIAHHFPSLEPGALPPFGPMVPAAAVIDSALLEHERILCPAGDHSHSVLVDPRDVMRITAADTADISED